MAELQQQQRFSHQNLPRRIRSQFGQPAQSEEHLQKRLALLTPKELKPYGKRAKQVAHRPADARNSRSRSSWPATMIAAYTKFYPTLEAARAELDLFLADQPLNFDLHVQENGFAFTN